jgi:hypothetical protein
MDERSGPGAEEPGGVSPEDEPGGASTDDESGGAPSDRDAGAAPTGMSEADARYAERLAVDLERVLGVGIAIDDLELVGEGPVTIRAALLVEGQVREIEATGETSLEAYQGLVRAAAELRLAAAWWRLVGPT